MHIVSAGVHDGLLYAVCIAHCDGAGVGEAGDFFYWEGVHVCPEEDGVAGAISEDAGETEAADVGVDVEGI